MKENQNHQEHASRTCYNERERENQNITKTKKQCREAHIKTLHFTRMFQTIVSQKRKDTHVGFSGRVIIFVFVFMTITDECYDHYHVYSRVQYCMEQIVDFVLHVWDLYVLI